MRLSFSHLLINTIIKSDFVNKLKSLTIYSDNFIIDELCSISLPSLQSLSIPNCFSGEKLRFFLDSKVLSMYENITSLDLSCIICMFINYLDNFITFPVLENLCRILENTSLIPQLSSISLEGNILTGLDHMLYCSLDVSQRQIESINLSCINYYCQIFIDCSINRISNNFPLMFKDNFVIKRLYFGHNLCGDDIVSYISDAIENNQLNLLEVVDLKQNNITNKGWVKFLQSLNSFLAPNITQLSLSWNLLTVPSIDIAKICYKHILSNLYVFDLSSINFYFLIYR